MARTQSGVFTKPQQFISIAAAITDQILRHPMVAEQFRQENRVGGFFCLAQASNPDPASFLVGQVGVPNSAKAEKYRAFCEEKVVRLFAHPLHRLSYQSRDEAKEQWGGGVRGKRLIAALSFLPEQLDEIWSYGFLRAVRDLSFDEVATLLDSYPNKFEPIYYDLNV